MYVSVIQFSIYAVNFIVKFQTIAKILPIYCMGILIRATLYILVIIITLRASCSALYCNRSCLCVCVFVCVGLLPR